MKRLAIFYLIAVIVLITACSPGPEKGGTKESAADPLKDFKSYIASAENPSEVKENLDKLMDGADTETSDALILEYLNYMEGILSGNQTYPAETLTSAGFKMISAEGTENPVIDYHFIDAYSGQVSKELSDFSGFMALNSDAPWAKDAAIVIPLEDLADRIARGEQFLVKYPDSVTAEKVRIQYEYYLKSFLGGLDNTPLVSYDTNKINSKFIDAFDYFLRTYPDLATSKTVENFRAELAAVNFTAPYSYTEDEKRNAFNAHVDKLVSDTLDIIR